MLVVKQFNVLSLQNNIQEPIAINVSLGPLNYIKSCHLLICSSLEMILFAQIFFLSLLLFLKGREKN